MHGWSPRGSNRTRVFPNSARCLHLPDFTQYQLPSNKELEVDMESLPSHVSVDVDVKSVVAAADGTRVSCGTCGGVRICVITRLRLRGLLGRRASACTAHFPHIHIFLRFEVRGYLFRG